MSLFFLFIIIIVRHSVVLFSLLVDELRAFNIHVYTDYKQEVFVVVAFTTRMFIVGYFLRAHR